ncbi:M20 metallopeptidase family protein [Streptoalloteichus hindustanus]|uniref:Amidohydrolase n=1 Tax=Streptoalloteichus hindustanus TaxID=2017 RepID=A0A1M4Z0P6_STRHI|nr:amidohydrolase [Streptoalloteichus hindustanus]SHF11653.1 amidohydrolase [Streptoalloteichus hindustanus]
MSVDGTAAHLAALRAALREELPAAVELRRELHAQPNLSGQEGPTRKLLVDALPADLAVEQVADTGAVVRVGPAGPAVGVRAELDALPIVESTGVPWAAASGMMHACGHDVHMAALVALVRAVHRVGGPAPLVAVCQPREETSPSGANDIVASALLRRHRVEALVAAHVHPQVAPGEVAVAGGAVNASADEFEVTVRGKAGHAAYPHLTRDPVLALAHFVTAAQQLVSRDTDPMEPAVVAVCALTAGAAANAVPAEAVARGTVRAMSESQRDLLHERLREIAGGVAMTHGCRADVEITRGEPVLHNDFGLAKATAELLTAMSVPLGTPVRSCGADDFAFYQAVAPLLMMFVGVDGNTGDGLHAPTFLPADTAVGQVADSLLAGYLAAAAQWGQQVPSSYTG